MTGLRLVADDLTGALDAAIAFVTPGQHVPVYWNAPPSAAPSRLAIDSGTRETDAASARARVAALLRNITPDADTLFFAKLDSLLRGQAAAEIAAWMEALQPRRCIIAPAFPRQGRVTRGGIQYLCRDGAERPVGADLRATLEAEGHPVHLRRPGEAMPDGVSLWDSETDTDLAQIVAAGRPADGTTLWCGSGGLAAALTGHPSGIDVAPRTLPRPILGLFGTDHPVTMAQLAACGDAVLALSADGRDNAAALGNKLAADGVALARLALPEGTPRPVAAARIAEAFSSLVAQLDPPGTLIVSGGETLRSLCAALEAERLDLYGQIESGVPCSILRGGRFDGVHIISKSGAFGAPSLLRRLTETSEGDDA
ncbi:uncharacterized protein YgbK (DUF1537 family) [Azorhizobium sp. AG788]|uniref:four-carbon acid sugar kinase family protein n=1 Tax=Azorhizobium sp. AG788 TaxID=2183897 RepID=UPI00105CB86C|nr:four-carbon acid sugar kinase family protein [Azorhizobium sp. AG788]TDT96817.1 uncharacterized protein YgbK (DUF1537 family) [Azorhizobium sp. AG788]